jgi:glycosyltransferase involved in cell wall biosynthesis
MRVPLTVVIPTFNEARQIAEAVSALAWADQVVVVDGGSTDATRALAQDAGAEVIALRDTTIGAQRNVGSMAARNRWVLALDADERVSPELQRELERLLPDPPRQAYDIRFRNYFLGRELRHGPYGRDWHVRLFTRERRYSLSRVHERLEPIGDVGRLEAPILHTSFRHFGHYVDKVFRYARWGADDLATRGRRATLADVLLRPWWRFFRDYLLWGGFRDGRSGFLLAAFAAVGTLLKYSYRWTEQ